MRTVPLSVAATLFAPRPDLRVALADAGRHCGRRVELDLDAVRAAAGPAAAELLEAYAARCESLWELLENSEHVPAGAAARWVAVRRLVATHQQVTGKNGRADLVEVYEALADVPAVGELLEQVTATDPDLSVLRAMASTLHGHVDRPSADTMTVEISLEGGYALPDLLGGVPWPGEVRRVLEITTRQAAWRDRRVRRLAQVRVSVDEIWADPRDLADAVARLPLAG